MARQGICTPMMIMAKASPQSLRKARGGPPKNRHREAILTQLTQPLSSHARPLTRTRTTYRYLMFCLSSSAGSIGTSLASQSSHLNNAFFFCLRTRIFYFAIFLEEPSFSHSFLDVRAYCRESTASTAQRSQPCTKQQSKHVPIIARQRKRADRVGESREPVCRRAFIQLAVFSKRTEKSKSARRTKSIQPLTKQL